MTTPKSTIRDLVIKILINNDTKKIHWYNKVLAIILTLCYILIEFQDIIIGAID